MDTSLRAHDPETRSLGSLAPRLRSIGLVAALLGLVGSFLVPITGGTDWEFALHGYLVNAVFFLTLSLGALFFVMIHHVTSSAWGIVVRRLAEGIAAGVFPLAVVFLPIVLRPDLIYLDWARDPAELSPLVREKSAYLDPGFFTVRMAVYFAIWIYYARSFLRASVRQDRTRDPEISARLRLLSAPGLIVLALTTSFASFDLLMSLRAEWFSTIFGVYFFAGCAVGYFALLGLMVIGLQATGRLPEVTGEHFHDIGKFTFGFVVFWAYIAYSQFMLIWYANLPEETSWYQPHLWDPGWQRASVFLITGHFLIPFLALMSRHVKRRRAALAAIAVWLLLVHWFDLFCIVMPTLRPSVGEFATVPLGVAQIVAMGLGFAGIGGLWLAWVAHRLRDCSLLPVSDPRLPESLAFENR